MRVNGTLLRMTDGKETWTEKWRLGVGRRRERIVTLVWPRKWRWEDERISRVEAY